MKDGTHRATPGRSGRQAGARSRRPWTAIWPLFLPLAFCARHGFAERSVALVEKGEARAVIVVAEEVVRWKPPKGSRERRRRGYEWQADEQLAAEELQEHLRAITGVELEIVPAGTEPAGRLPIYVGQAAGDAVLEAVRKRSTKSGSLAVIARPREIRLRGLTPYDTQLAVYELLEQIGVRWYMPGGIGRVLPEKTDTLAVAVQETIRIPSFANRHLQAIRAPEWERRLRKGGLHFPGSHGVRLPPEASFEKHPEYYALIDGVHKKRQLCVSNPEVVRLATETTREYFRKHPDAEIMGIGANDGRGFCECPNCRALDGGDYDPFGHYPSMTDRYVWFFNRILDGIRDEFPDKKLGFYAYSVYNRPPVKVEPNRRLVPAVCLITLCRIHGMGNPVCPEKQYEKWIIREWGKRVPEVYYRGYWFNLACPGLPFFMMSRIAREVRLGREFGIAGWRVETPHNWAASCPSAYLAYKLMWDVDTDVQALMDEFYQKFFGPAAAPMKRYIKTMDEARRDADFHTGCSWDLSKIYDERVRAVAREAFRDATGLAPRGSMYARRVEVYRKAWEHFEAFAAMMETRARHDYVASKEALDRMDGLREELWSYEPKMIGRKAESYLKRFFRTTTEQGYERVTGGNTFLAGFDDVWEFQTDPERVGESVGWWDPENTGGRWQTIRTSTATWSNQGLRYYKGLAWYRQAVRVPATARGRRIFLWIGAYDEGAKVWLNGRELGITPKMAFKPCEMDATRAVRPGARNTLVICVRNEQLNEVGTGGIMGPVMFYIPAPGREIENLKPLGKTFPEY